MMLLRCGLLLTCAALLPAQEPPPPAAPGFLMAALSITPEPWDKQANFDKFARFTRQAAAQGAQVIVAPEGYLEGYVGNQGRTPDLDQARYAAHAAEDLNGPLLTQVRALAKELHVYLMIGFAEKRGGRVFNTAVMFSPEGKLASQYAKSHTMNDEPFNTKGDSFPVVKTEFGQWGTLICFDRQVPEAARILAIKGADMIFVPAWGSYGEMNDQLMRVRAYENGVNLAFVHPKRALLIDAGGNILAQNKGDGDQIVLGRFTVSPKRKHSMLKYRRPALYQELSRP